MLNAYDEEIFYLYTALSIAVIRVADPGEEYSDPDTTFEKKKNGPEQEKVWILTRTIENPCYGT